MTETSSANLERQAEAVRAQLADTADRLKAKMTPGQLMDEVLQQFKGGDGSRMVANLKGQVRDNPMALALIGSGLAWLMMGSGEAADTEQPGYSYSGGSDRFGAGGGAQRLADEPSLGDRAADAVGSARDSVAGAFGAANAKVGEMAHSAKTFGTDVVGGTRDTAGSIGGQVNRTFFDVLEREPLVIGALGVAVGAAIGAALPATQLEKERLADVGRGLKEKVGAFIDQGASEVKTAVSDVYEAARDEADSQGLLAGKDSLATKVGNVAQAAKGKADEIVDRQLRRQEVPAEEHGEEFPQQRPGARDLP